MPETPYKGSALAKARSAVAVAHRRRDPAAIEEANREFAAEKIASYVAKVLAEAPPLTVEQRCRLAELLRPARQKIVAERLAELDAEAGTK